MCLHILLLLAQHLVPMFETLDFLAKQHNFFLHVVRLAPRAHYSIRKVFHIPRFTEDGVWVDTVCVTSTAAPWYKLPFTSYPGSRVEPPMLGSPCRGMSSRFSGGV